MTATGAGATVRPLAPAGDTANGTGGERERTSWWPVPLGGEAATPPEPSILLRDDGAGLVYPGRVNALVGESETCKTWMAYLAALGVVRLGGDVIIVDFEDNAATATARLRALGLSDRELRHVHFLSPNEPLADRTGKPTAASADLGELLAEHPPTFGVVDGVTEGMGLDGLDPLDNADVARWYRRVARRIAATGAGVAVLDHVTKDREGRGRYALGGVHKLNGLDGCALLLHTLEPFAPGRTGRVGLTVAKDRPGAVRAVSEDGKRAGVLVIDGLPDGRVAARIEAPDASNSAAPFVPTGLMERVSRHVELYPGEGKRDLRALGKGEYVDQAIAALVERGHLRVEREGQRHRHYVVKPYREQDEEATS